MDKRGQQLIKEIRALSLGRNITTPTGTLIQDKEVYFTYLENYFNKDNIDSKWVDILEQIKKDLENEKLQRNI